MKVGARIFKTGIAITLGLYIALFFGLHSPIFAAIAAAFAIQPSIYKSYQSILEQIQANVIGAFFAIVFGLTFGTDPMVIGLTAIIVIAINLKLKIESTIPIALVTVIAIMETPGDYFFEFSLLRFASIMLGVFSAFIVNLVFLPPKYETKLYYKVLNNTEEIVKWIRISTRHASEHTALKENIEYLHECIIKMESFFFLYKDERTYTRKKKYAKARKLVLFRQMLKTTKRALYTLKKLHRHENEFNHLPESFKNMIVGELDHLSHYHDQILLKFAGKIRPHATAKVINHGNVGKEKLTEAFIDIYNKDHLSKEIWIQVFPLISDIVEYSVQLEHLNKLVDSFQNYHKESNEVRIKEENEKIS
jgi:uncharacterized membrane protein YgaE (UPF0421/DUF939 family)